MKKELPKLPRGMGSYCYVRDDTIRYKKMVEAHELVVYGKTLKEVNDKMKEKESEFQKKKKRELIALKTRTLEEGMEAWMKRYKQPELSQHSYDRVECTFNCHVKDSALGITQEQAIDSDLIQDFMNELKSYKGDKLSYSSKKKVYELLSQYFRYLYSKDPTSNPMIDVVRPKKDNTIIKNEDLIVWDDDEMMLIYQEAFREYIEGISGYKYGLLVSFLMWSFMRIGEMLALEWSDIDFENETVNINKQIARVKNRKEDATEKYIRITITPKYYSIRKIKLPKPALESIKEYKNRCGNSKYVCAGEDGEIFPESRINQTYSTMKKNLGLRGKNVTIHGLRHSGISYLLRHKVPIEVVSRMAGHSDVSTTMNIYYSIISSQKDNAIEEFNKIFD